MNRTSRPKAVAPSTATTRPATSERKPVVNISRSPSTVPVLAVSAAPTCGAITIAPTTIAGESNRSPAVATTALISVSP
ncbi:hypothetical protein [Halalkalicoccus salilacus]|uniref:hypothetical protein n=1 Tax=Halalkalicoccus sp. GCM10025704 TaxID=3252662 RepID=UPI0036115CFD